MQTVHLKVHGQIESNGRLHLDVQTQLPAGEADVVLTISSANGSKKMAIIFRTLRGS